MAILQNCSFGSENCNLNCKKYPMCSYMSIQKQITSLQEKINFIYITITNLINSEVSIQDSLKETNERLESYVCELLDVFNNSENKKESNSEKGN